MNMRDVFEAVPVKYTGAPRVRPRYLELQRFAPRVVRSREPLKLTHRQRKKLAG